MTRHFFRTAGTLAVALLVSVAPMAGAQAQDLKTGGVLRVGVFTDVFSFDPQQFTIQNFPYIKNLYDSLIEYTAEGEAVPHLAESWEVAGDNMSVVVRLRGDVTFHSGNTMTSADVAATLEKAADPQRGKNIYPTMGIVEGWETPDATTVTIRFKQRVPDRQITDFLQALVVLEKTGIDTIETVPAGTGPFKVGNRITGQSLELVKNPDYFIEGQPVLDALNFEVFSDNAAAAAALESNAIDLSYNGSPRNAVRLRDAGFTVVTGPGKQVQALRINSTRGPFRNEKFRQAFNYLMDRESMLNAAYSGLGQPTALPWAPASPAFDASYAEEFAYDLDKAKQLLAESGLSAAEMSDWQLSVNASSAAFVTSSQILVGSLSEIGINVTLDMKEGAQAVAVNQSGDYFATFGGTGNIQKFPTRLTTNSLYRTNNNPVFGEPHPHPEYVEAIARVNNAFGTDVQPAYDNLNRALVEAAFGIPTNTFEAALIVAAPTVGGFIADIDNLLIARGLGFKN